MQFNRNIDALEPSKSVALMARVRELQKTNPDILDLTAGDPDFPTPKPICGEAVRSMKEGFTHYTNAQGIPELREAIAKKLLEENGIPFGPDGVIVTPGGKFAVYLAVRTLLNDGDEAIWLTPGWVSYPSIVQAAGGVPKAVHLNFDEEYCIRQEALEDACTSRTRLLILNYPNNPTGKILTPADKKAVAGFLRSHPDIWVLSDEMYEKIIFDGKKAESIAADPEFSDRTIVINGFSKSSAMTGWRIGYLAAGPKFCRMAMKLFSHTMSCTSGLAQRAALKALSCKKETEQMRSVYERRRNLITQVMTDIPNIDYQQPDGAFYAWFRIHTDQPSGVFARELLEKAKIAGVPGDSFGAENGCYIRFTFAVSDEVIQQMLERLKHFMQQQNGNGGDIIR